MFFAIWGIYRLLHRDWLNGAVLIAGWVAVSVIGFGVGKPSDRLKGDDAYLMSKGATKIVLVCFAMFAFLLVNGEVPWYYAIPSGFLVALAVAMIPLGVLLIVVMRRH